MNVGVCRVGKYPYTHTCACLLVQIIESALLNYCKDDANGLCISGDLRTINFGDLLN